MFQRLPIALTQVKAANLKIYYMKFAKSYIFYIKQNKLLKEYKQYNEFNKVIKQNGYYIYEF